MRNLFIQKKLQFEGIKEKGFFHLFTANIFIQIFAFASQLFVAGILSPEDVGRIKIIQSYLAVFSILAGMGFNASTLKICSENRSNEEQLAYRNSGIIFTLISSVLLYILILILNYFSIFSSDFLLGLLIPMGLFPLISSSVFAVYMSYYQGIKKIKKLSDLTISNKIISIAGIILLSFYFGIKGYFIAFNLSFIIMLIFIFINDSFIKISKDFNIIDLFRNHWRYASQNLLAAIVAELSGLLDIILIGWLVKDMNEVGYYSFALTLTIVLRIFPTTVQQITIPYFSSFEAGKEQFMQIFHKYNKLLIFVCVFTLIIFVLLMPPILNTLFENKYDNSVFYLYLLGTGWTIRNLNQLQTGAIFGLGKIKYNAYLGFIVLIFNLLTYPLGFYFFGINGIAWASIFSGIVFYIFSGYYFRKAVKSTF